MNRTSGQIKEQTQCQADEEEPPGFTTTGNIVVVDEDENPQVVVKILQ